MFDFFQAHFFFVSSLCQEKSNAKPAAENIFNFYDVFLCHANHFLSCLYYRLVVYAQKCLSDLNFCIFDFLKIGYVRIVRLWLYGSLSYELYPTAVCPPSVSRFHIPSCIIPGTDFDTLPGVPGNGLPVYLWYTDTVVPTRCRVYNKEVSFVRTYNVRASLPILRCINSCFFRCQWSL